MSQPTVKERGKQTKRKRLTDKGAMKKKKPVLVPQEIRGNAVEIVLDEPGL
jgi:hypothetical protein